MTPPSLDWLQALREPERACTWTLADWQRVLRLARRLRLMGRLAHGLRSAGLTHQLPVPVQRHVESEWRQARWRQTALRWTVERVGAVLAGTPYPRLLLKGAAYESLALDFSRGRLAGDLDILVPRAHLAEAQQRLIDAGWSEPRLDAHDQQYYHAYSHEVPPMTHPQHAFELDLHHNILPPVGQVKVDADVLLARAQASHWTGWQLLSPVDMVLHSAAHLFLDGEPQERLRDLVDMDGMLRCFGTRPGFWDELPARARELGLMEPLSLALHFTTRWLGLQVPAQVLVACTVPRGPWVHLLEKVLMPIEPDALPARGQDLAALALLVRYHRRRMPLSLLVPHLWHKVRRPRIAPEDPAPPADRR
jgi:Uncharacterised nucleotidyltransferase